MALIRQETIASNQQGRGGCLVQSPYTGAVYYVTLEHGWVVLRDWDKAERARETEAQCAMFDPKVSACFANAHSVIVHVAGFHVNTNDSASQTFELTVQDAL